jgi:hypothetical protein
VKAWKKYIRSGKNDKLYDKYKKKLNKSVKINNNAKRDFENKLASNIKK